MRIVKLLTIVACFRAIDAHEVYIDSVKGQCKTTCLYKQTPPCCSLEYIASEFGSNVSNLTIHLPQTISVSQLILFRDVSLLSFTGFSKQKTSLICTSSTRNASLFVNYGLRFNNVTFLKISNVLIKSCEAKHFSVGPVIVKASIAVVNCRNIELHNVDMIKSSATAMFIENASGNVSLINVSVLNHGNKRLVEPATSYAKGIFIYSNSSVTKAYYVIKNSEFVNITTWEYKNYDVRRVRSVNDWLGYGLGGGLSIVFDEDASYNNVSVINCTFKNNLAPWGAGMYIRFDKNSSINLVSIVNSSFEICSAVFAGGGLGICLVKRKYNGNTVYVQDTTFFKNHAKYGGGTYICALHSNCERIENAAFVRFNNCNWIENRGGYSPAVDISPTQFDQQQSGVLPVPIFENCKFLRNKNEFWRKRTKARFVSSGVFVVTKFTVKFSGNVHFDSNHNTAILLNSARIILEENIFIVFKNNTGFRGGAISLNGFSHISIKDNCKAHFINNQATEYGGAIFYYPIEQREFFAGRVCFLKYDGNHSLSVDKRNISFVFSDNTASIQGSAIYSTSFYPCYYSYRGNIHGHQVYDFFKEIGSFSFNSTKIKQFLGTAARNISSTNQALSVLPGQKLTLPITVQDELYKQLRSEFFVQIKKSKDSKSYIKSPYTINKTVIIYGRPKDNATVVISSQHVYRTIQYEMDVTLLPCPPGYYHDISKLSCECSYRNQSKFYVGIKKCNDKNFTAVIQKGFWAGYHSERYDKLYTARCPFQFCILNTKLEAQHSLPNSSQALNVFMCGPTRRGVLCGQCEDGFSTFYHSRAFSCGSSHLCFYGIIFFIVSDILPVLLFFTIVIIFDISFSSGARNGFIFFSQMVTILPSEFITVSNGYFHEYLTVGYTWIYGIFNIDFLSTESLSFCLFSGATVMDALAFKYITSVFALILVLLLTIGIKYCNCCDKFCSKLKKKLTTKDSLLNGLSAFLVISYAECVRVSFFILRLNVLKGEGGAFGPYVAFYGGIDYFEGRHLVYAILALFTLATIGLLPPLLLLLYPSTMKVLQLCKLSEHKLVLALLRATRINALMPMFDVFQGCFKDNCRFFAGLYFFYRAALLVPYSFSQNIFECAVFAELVLVFLLGLHSTVHPYKKSRYNAIDSLLLCDLAIINGITIFLKLKISETQESFEENFILKTYMYIQLLFIYLPVLIVGLHFVKKILFYCQKKRQNDQANNESDLLDYMEYRNDAEESENDTENETK